MKAVVLQNYSTFLNKLYQLTKGVALRSPILSIVAEIFWQFYEDTYMKHLLRTSNVVFYKHYVDGKDWCRTHHLQWNHIHGSIIFVPCKTVRYSHCTGVSHHYRIWKFQCLIFRYLSVYSRFEPTLSIIWAFWNLVHQCCISVHILQWTIKMESEQGALYLRHQWALLCLHTHRVSSLTSPLLMHVKQSSRVSNKKKVSFSRLFIVVALKCISISISSNRWWW